MKPRKQRIEPQDDLFKVRLKDLINLGHPICRLAEQIDWEMLDAEIAPNFSDEGAPALPVRLVAGLMYLQHAEKVSDERVVERWLQDPYWQYFCGETFFQHQFPCDRSSLTNWRKRLGEEGCEWLLTATIDAGLSTKVISQSSLKRVVVDTTVQEKAVTHPTDSQLYERSRQALVKIAHERGITLRQTYQKEAPPLARKVGRYAHARQFRRMRRALKQLKGRLGRVLRDLERQLPEEAVLSAAEQQSIHHAKRLLAQTTKSKNKLYSLRAPEVECISKGKSHKRYKFGVKVSFATTLKECFVVGARSFPGNPYDGHTLDSQLEQVGILCGRPPDEAYVDRGYRGHNHAGSTQIFLAGQKRGISAHQKTRLKRRNTIEPIIGHMKRDGKLDRCHYKGRLGDAVSAILAAVGQNIRKLLKWLLFAQIRCLFAWLRGLIAYAKALGTQTGHDEPLNSSFA